MTIRMIKEILTYEHVDDETLTMLKEDQRKGVQKLIKTYEKEQLKQIKMVNQFEEMCRYERENYLKGMEYIAGVDEAGRSEEHTSELQSRGHLVCRLLLEKK